MWPVLAQVTLLGVERSIASYGVMFALALLSASGLLVAFARRDGLDIGRVIACVGIVVGAGMIGANVLFALVETLRNGELPWLAFRWIEGETLEERVLRDGALDLRTACSAAGQVLEPQSSHASSERHALPRGRCSRVCHDNFVARGGRSDTGRAEELRAVAEVVDRAHLNRQAGGRRVF